MENKEGIDPEVNKIVSMQKKWKKMFHTLHKGVAVKQGTPEHGTAEHGATNPEW